MEIVLEQNAFEAIRPKKNFESDFRTPPSQSVPSRIGLEWSSTNQFRSDSNVLQCEILAQRRAWNDIESFGALKLVEPGSTADKKALELPNDTTYHDCTRYHVELLILW